MRKESAVTFDEVKATFIRENAANSERNDWPLGALTMANWQFGNWTRVVLTPEDVLTVMLPMHSHGVDLVPAAGSTVSDAIEKLKSVDRLSECYKRIQDLSKRGASSIFLSVAPIDDPGYSDYKGLLDRGCRSLTHLDGLHRLIAWGRENRREATAYVAGLT